jgi:hypothetical protein
MKLAAHSYSTAVMVDVHRVVLVRARDLHARCERLIHGVLQQELLSRNVKRLGIYTAGIKRFGYFGGAETGRVAEKVINEVACGNRESLYTVTR